MLYIDTIDNEDGTTTDVLYYFHTRPTDQPPSQPYQNHTPNRSQTIARITALIDYIQTQSPICYQVKLVTVANHFNVTQLSVRNWVIQSNNRLRIEVIDRYAHVILNTTEQPTAVKPKKVKDTNKLKPNQLEYWQQGAPEGQRRTTEWERKNGLPEFVPANQPLM